MPATQSERVTPAQAHYVVQRLIAERRVSPGEIAAYLAELPTLIKSLEARLTTLRGIANGTRHTPQQSRSNPAQKQPRKSAPRRDQSWRTLNGRYAGLVRQFPPAKRAEYKRMSKERGKEFTITRMREALGK
jgi:hypothetical protein